MGAILLNVCVGAMFYDPVSRHMKKVLVPREKNENSSEQETEAGTNLQSATQTSSDEQPRRIRQV